jgi:hypothetical protein
MCGVFRGVGRVLRVSELGDAQAPIQASVSDRLRGLRYRASG